MKAILLLLAFWAHGGSAPVVKVKIAVAPVQYQGGPTAAFNLDASKLKLSPVNTSPLIMTPSVIRARNNPFILVPQNYKTRTIAEVGPEQSGLITDYLQQSVTFDRAVPAQNDNAYAAAGETYGAISEKVAKRIVELRRKFEQERVAPANAMNFSNDIGAGHLAEIAVIRREGRSLVNVSEEVKKDGSTIGEIDAETRTHLIEVASGDLNSGYKSKVQQFIKFLRAEAKKRNKSVKYYYNPDKADPEDIERIKKIGRKQGITVEFVPIPWEEIADMRN